MSPFLLFQSYGTEIAAKTWEVLNKYLYQTQPGLVFKKSLCRCVLVYSFTTKNTTLQGCFEK